MKIIFCINDLYPEIGWENRTNCKLYSIGPRQLRQLTSWHDKKRRLNIVLYRPYSFWVGNLQ